MFTGIIENLGRVKKVSGLGSGKTFQIDSPLAGELRVDQSVSHNGACLTVESVSDGSFQVTAIKETLDKTNLNAWKTGDLVNLERCLKMNDRLDGHIVQGHVDTTAICVEQQETIGSWQYRFKYPKQFAHLIIEKGSVCLNGISLTVFDITDEEFSVAIIPYTYHNTNIKNIEKNSLVNIEFDLIGKYLSRLQSLK